MLLVLMLAACGGGGSGSGEDAASAGGQSASGVQVTGDLESKPAIEVPQGDPPAELEVTDLVEGDGDEVAQGASVTAHYLGVSWSTGEEFDSSWNGGEPATFPLDGVIQGWGEGLPGMRVGGRRLLVIPPDLAYGDASPTPAIGPGETLVFVVDMVATE